MALKKQLGFLPVMLSGIGIILGAGIYALIGKAAGVAGYGVWLSFVLAAIVAGFTGLSYAELSSMIPKAGAEFHYAKKAFGKSIGFFTAWLLVLAGFISAATVALGFGGYLQAFAGIPLIAGAIALLVACTVIIYFGIRQSTGIASVFTIIEAAGLLIIIAIGLPLLFSPAVIGKVFDFGSFSMQFVVQAAALIFFAYIGFEEIARLAEETKDAERNIPKALLVSIIVSTILYVLVALAAVSVLSPEALASSNAPLGDVAGKVFGSSAFLLLTIIALFSTANTVLLILLATSRLLYGIAEDKELPHIISRVDRKTQTPTVALIVAAVFSIAFLFFGNISTIANATDFLLFAAFIVINLSVIKLRYSLPEAERPFKIPFNIGKLPVIPVLGVLACLFLISGIEARIIGVGAALAFLGLAFEKHHWRKHNA